MVRAQHVMQSIKNVHQAYEGATILFKAIFIGSEFIVFRGVNLFVDDFH